MRDLRLGLPHVSPSLRDMGSAESDDMGTSCSGHCERKSASMQMGSAGQTPSSAPPVARCAFNPVRACPGLYPCAINDSNAIIDDMASLIIRNLEESTKRRLKLRAATNGRSMEHEAREILKSALKQKPQKPRTGADLAEAIRRRFAPLGGLELELPPREPMRDPDWLRDWE